MLEQYLPGVVFLVMVCAAIAFVVALFVPAPRRAILIGAASSTTLLTVWAYVEIGGFDLGFLAILALISLASTTGVVGIVSVFRRQRQTAI